PFGGEMSTVAESTAPKLTCVASSASAGVELPCAYTATRSGTPFAASNASCASPSSPPSCFGDTVTVYAGCEPTLSGFVEIVACCEICVRTFVMSESPGGALLADEAFAGSVSSYTVFDEASYAVTRCLFQTIWTSPASDCSSSRPRPSSVAQRRPVAPERSAEPAAPVSAPEGNSLFVNVISALMPCGLVPLSASCNACASGFGGGVGPPPRAATASAALPPATTTRNVTSATRRVVESVRRMRMTFLLARRR